MARYTKTDLTTGFQNTVVNTNFQALETAIADMLSRKAGDTPNDMEIDLDMGNNKIINLDDPVDDHDAVNKGYGDDNYGGGAVTQSAANAAAAAASASSASTSASSATSSASAASSSASAASSSASAASSSASTAAAAANSLNIRTISNQSGNYTILAPDDRNKVIRYTGSGGHTFTLPTVASAAAQFEILVLNDGSGNLTVDGAGAEQIQGVANIVVPALGFVTLVANSSSWSVTATRKYDSALSNVVEDTTPELGGTLFGNGYAINEAKGADIASAATTDIGAATGNFVHVTGTTTITALGTVAAGTRRTVEFTGALTLTHNATSLILPTGANITTAAGDMAVFVSEGSGNWRCVSYSPADGLPKATVTVAKGGTGGTSATAYAVQCGGTTSTGAHQSVASVGTANQVLTSNGAGALPTFQNLPSSGGLVFIASATASSSATVNFTSGITSTYKSYIIIMSNVKPATDAVILQMRMSVAGVFKSGASDYWYVTDQHTTGGTDFSGSTGAAALDLSKAIGNATNEKIEGTITIYDPANGSNWTSITQISSYQRSDEGLNSNTGAGAYIGTTSAVDGFQFLMSSGNIASGLFKLYGVVAS